MIWHLKVILKHTLFKLDSIEGNLPKLPFLVHPLLQQPQKRPATSHTFYEYTKFNLNIIVFYLIHAACGFSSNLSLVSNEMHSLRTVWVGFGSPDAALSE